MGSIQYLVRWIAWAILFLLGYVLGNCVLAGPLEVDYLAVETSKFEGRREASTPNTPQGDYQQRAALRWDVSLWKNIYWNNNTHCETTSGGVKTVGWLWEAGLRVTPWLDVFKAHHSQHVVDEPSQVRWEGSAGKFPNEDSLGVRLIFIPQVTRRALYE